VHRTPQVLLLLTPASPSQTVQWQSCCYHIPKFEAQKISGVLAL
jgi:hypothetical protein